jgi:hypothetical protein
MISRRLLLSLPLLAACDAQKRTQETNPVQRSANMSDLAIGRFRLSLPEGLRAAGRTQSIYGVSIRTAPAVDVSAEDQWNARVAALANARPVAFPGGAKGVWFNPNPALPSAITLEAIRPMGSHALWIVRSATAGGEQAAERLVAKILSVYEPGFDRGFCAEHGSIRMEGSLTESAEVSIADPSAPGLKVEFATKTVSEPDTRSLTSIDDERRLVRLAGGSLDVRAERDRTVNGMTGKEFRIAITIPGESTKLRYTWQFSGEGRNPSRPRIQVVASAESPDLAQKLDAAFDAVLSSLRPIPL